MFVIEGFEIYYIFTYSVHIVAMEEAFSFMKKQTNIYSGRS